jgi:hypothetical protein
VISGDGVNSDQVIGAATVLIHPSLKYENRIVELQLTSILVTKHTCDSIGQLHNSKNMNEP